MLSRVKRFLSEPSRFQKDVDPVERFARSGWSKASTPDELIAAHVIQLLAKDFDSWRSYSKNDVSYETLREGAAPENTHFVTHKFVYPTLYFHYRRVEDYKYNKRTGSSKTTVTRDSFSVNGVIIDDTAGNKIFSAYEKLRKGWTAAKEAAASAERQMKANEEKWNLAEELLRMKRDETGALVPVVDPEVPLPDCIREEECLCGKDDPKPRLKRRPRVKANNRFDAAVG